MTVKHTSTVNAIRYPRTGKRGLPQQFPRRLYEMLECEGKALNEKGFNQVTIQWSRSGRAFQITDVSLFASIILPKYFRTSKFSSFQRNLNLYGFSKVRRGPDTDMYAHPSFVRGCPEVLSELRKCSNSKERIQEDRVIGTSDTSTCSTETRASYDSNLPSLLRTITPLSDNGLDQVTKHQQQPQAKYNFSHPNPCFKSAISQPINIMWQEPNVYVEKPFSPANQKIEPSNLDLMLQKGNSKLALLAIALKILGD